MTLMQRLEVQRVTRATIPMGTILIEKDTPVPEFFSVGTGSYPNAWMRMSTNRSFREFEKDLSTAGWTFFYIAGEIKAIAFGLDEHRTIDAALSRLMANVTQQRCNSLEIDNVSTRSFFGMSYVSITAHSRHIQKGSVFGK